MQYHLDVRLASQEEENRDPFANSPSPQHVLSSQQELTSCGVGELDAAPDCAQLSSARGKVRKHANKNSDAKLKRGQVVTVARDRFTIRPPDCHRECNDGRGAGMSYFFF